MAELVEGTIYSVENRESFPAQITVEGGLIQDVLRLSNSESPLLLFPGFIDSHVHVESSMLEPGAFARQAVLHGTVGTISDPHEIANVCGLDGVCWMLDAAACVPWFTFCFGAPPCVPALGSPFETSGAKLDVAAVDGLLKDPRIGYLAEVMNYPGVLAGSHHLLEMMARAVHYAKPIDGHAPGLTGEAAARYAAAGPSTDHECSFLQEALDKLAAGMKIIIREGSAARNFEALHSLLETHPRQVMFGSDDLHPDRLARGHVNLLVQRAIRLGYDIFDVLAAASLNPAVHYGLDLGMLRKGDSADFIVARGTPAEFTVRDVWRQGKRVVRDGTLCVQSAEAPGAINNFECRSISCEDLRVPVTGRAVRAIRVIDGEILTEEDVFEISDGAEFLEANTARDLLKLFVVNRYDEEKPVSVGFVTGFGLQRGALASSVAHDCHNVIVVAADDISALAAANAGARFGRRTGCG